jgi:hypothetical protein
MGTFIFLLVTFAVLVVLMMTNSKHNASRPGLQKQCIRWTTSAAEEFEISQRARIISESTELVNNSKNFETRISRLELVITHLEEILKKYPHRTELKTELDKAYSHRMPLYTAAVEEKIEKCMSKSRGMKTVNAKINAANSALQAVNEGLSSFYTNKETLQDYAETIKQYIHDISNSIASNNENGICAKERVGNTLITTTRYADGRINTNFSHVPPKVDGIPTHELAEPHKDDMRTMLECCEAEMARYKSSSEPPAPYCFWRVAVLAKKAKDYALEVKICETYLAVTEELRARPDFDPRFPGITASPRTDELRKRLPKAKAMLATKQQEV